MDEEESPSLEPCREPRLEDLLNIARELNSRSVSYVIVGGFAIIHAGNTRTTFDLDILIDSSPENTQLALDALTILEDGAAKSVAPTEVEDYTVVRIADEITVDLMASACGVTFDEAKHEIQWHNIQGIPIPFASPKLLWWTKQTYREKDKFDLMFLSDLFRKEGSPVPPPPLT
ncbi:MAG: hypothetical protein PVJ98_00280 [Akkermansiaceae bacterium]|jgi:hypothetical protein